MLTVFPQPTPGMEPLEIDSGPSPSPVLSSTGAVLATLVFNWEWAGPDPAGGWALEDSVDGGATWDLWAATSDGSQREFDTGIDGSWQMRIYGYGSGGLSDNVTGYSNILDFSA